MALGQYTDALDILTGTYDSPDAAILEPGIPRASQHPLIWYYRGYCREKAGQSGANEYRVASGLPVQFVFPNKAITADVLTAALRLAPDDATALWLRGCALLALRRDCRLDLVCEC